MTFTTLIRRSLQFHARAHLGVVLGATIGSAALTGALIVGDSVKESLKTQALTRLGPIQFALYTADRLFRADLQERMSEAHHQGATNVGGVGRAAASAPASKPILSALLLRGVATRPDGTARLNHVNAIGVPPSGWPQMAGWAQALSTNHGRVPTLGEGAEKEARLGERPLVSWAAGEAATINETFAQRLNVRVGDEIIVRVEKPSALGLEAAIAPRDDNSVALRLKVGGILDRAALGDFSLQAQQVPPANVFLPLDWLSARLDAAGSANLIVASTARPPERELRQAWLPIDAGLSVRTLERPAPVADSDPLGPLVELTTSGVFLEELVVTAALSPRTDSLAGRPGFENGTANDLAFSQLATNGVGVLTYLANLIRCGERSTPYSMVTAAGPPYTPADLRDDEILVNDWLAEDLQVNPGDRLEVAYFVADSGSRLLERTNVFRVRGTVPLVGHYADRTLMPQFPGVARAESTHDWDAGFPLVYPIRDKDEDYWRRNRGTPKAFVTLAAGQKMWASRYGALTSIRYPVPSNLSAVQCREVVETHLRAQLNPMDLGFRFEPVRQQALRAAAQSQDFGQLFLGFSIFLVVSALLLMALLFQFGLEQRLAETGILLALGWTPGQVRRLFLFEGMALASLGALLGTLGGITYARVMLRALTTIWRSAIGMSVLEFHAALSTLLAGFLAGTAVAAFSIWLTLRRHARSPAVHLLAGGIAVQKKGSGAAARWLGFACAAAAALLVGWCVLRRDTSNPGVFFAAGALLLIAGVSLAAASLGRLAARPIPPTLTLSRLAVSGCARRRSRSLATIALLASGSFVIGALSVFRLDANKEATRPASGTGGFALLGTSALPIVHDLNTRSGRDFFGLNEDDLRGVYFVPFRVHEGDEASCLNLNRAQKPRLLGVKPNLLAGRFTFTATVKGWPRGKAWQRLSRSAAPSIPQNAEVAAVGDANSIRWALGRKLGDALDYTDERGRPFQVRLVGALANSVLQGSLIIDEADFIERFPTESGCRFFLIDAPVHEVPELSSVLSHALQDVGFEVAPAAQRLNAFNAVQNTYLGTFQILGGLGLLLGSAGLGVVVLRNVLERRAELGLLLAVGFRRRTLLWLLLGEHAALLAAGLGLGMLSAAVAVLPEILSSAAELPYRSLALTWLAVLINGGVWTWLATRHALGGRLLDSLRKE